MSKTDSQQLIGFLSPFNPEIQQLALWLRSYIWHAYPHCNELIYDNYNALAIGWSLTEKQNDIFCSIAVYGNKDVHFGFYWGSLVSDPEKRLLGKGSRYRYIRVNSKTTFPQYYINTLMAEAYANAMAKLKLNAILTEGKTIVKSVSALKKRPGIITPKKVKK